MVFSKLARIWELCRPRRARPLPVEAPRMTSVEAFLEGYRAFLANTWGQRCPDSAPGCPCCQQWALYDLFVALNPDPER